MKQLIYLAIALIITGCPAAPDTAEALPPPIPSTSELETLDRKVLEFNGLESDFLMHQNARISTVKHLISIEAKLDRIIALLEDG